MIFIPLNNNPVQSARDLTNFHIKKYVKTVTQILYVHVITHTGRYGKLTKSINAYELPQMETSNEKWLKESDNNIVWLIEFGIEVHNQYEIRNGKNHESCKDFTQLSSLILGTFMRAGIEYNSNEITSFILTIPEMYHVYQEPLECFKYYYVQAKQNQFKSGFGKSKKTPAPEWMSEAKYVQEIDNFEGGTKLAKMVSKYNDKAVKGPEKKMILDFIKKEAEKLRVPVERLLYSKFEKRDWKYFRWYTKPDQDLFHQLVLNVFGAIPIYLVYGEKRKVKEYKIKLTDIEYIEFNNIYEFHREKMKDEYNKIIDSLAVAYCAKNNLRQRFDIDVDYLSDIDENEKTDNFDTHLAVTLSDGMAKHTYIKGIE